MALVMVLAAACWHGQAAPGVEEHLGEQRQAATQLAWTYDLTYTQSTGSGRSLLASVKRTGSLGGQSYAKKFSWEETKGGVFTNGSSLGAFGDPNFEMTSIDVDNNGKDELLVAMPVPASSHRCSSRRTALVPCWGT